MKTVAAGLAVIALISLQDSKDRRLQENLKDTGIVGAWVYDDLDAGIAAAKKAGKPLMVVYRCVP
jgi:hypothetical protein